VLEYFGETVNLDIQFEIIKEPIYFEYKYPYSSEPRHVSRTQQALTTQKVEISLWEISLRFMNIIYTGNASKYIKKQILRITLEYMKLQFILMFTQSWDARSKEWGKEKISEILLNTLQEKNQM
jgi:hypothetical protein